MALDKFKAQYSPGDGVGEEDIGAIIGLNQKPKGRNACLLTMGAASWDWLCGKRSSPIQILEEGGNVTGCGLIKASAFIFADTYLIA